MEVRERMDCEVCVGDGSEAGGGEVTGAVVGSDGDGALDGALEGSGACVSIGSASGVLCAGAGGAASALWLVVGTRSPKRSSPSELSSSSSSMATYEVGISNSALNTRDSLSYLLQILESFK